MQWPLSLRLEQLDKRGLSKQLSGSDMFSKVYSTDLNSPLPGTSTRSYIENHCEIWRRGGFQVAVNGLPHQRVDAFDESGHSLRDRGPSC